MRLTLQAFGHELDITLGPLEVEAEPEFKPYQDAGVTSSMVIGFVPSSEPDWVEDE